MSRLAWSTTNASTLILNGFTTAGSGTTVHPAATTTYMLIASNASGSATASVTVTVGSMTAVYGNLRTADIGAGANLNGAIPFPADNPWNTDISSAPVEMVRMSR